MQIRPLARQKGVGVLEGGGALVKHLQVNLSVQNGKLGDVQLEPVTAPRSQRHVFAGSGLGVEVGGLGLGTTVGSIVGVETGQLLPSENTET